MAQQGVQSCRAFGRCMRHTNLLYPLLGTGCYINSSTVPLARDCWQPHVNSNSLFLKALFAESKSAVAWVWSHRLQLSSRTVQNLQSFCFPAAVILEELLHCRFYLWCLMGLTLVLNSKRETFWKWNYHKWDLRAVEQKNFCLVVWATTWRYS